MEEPVDFSAYDNNFHCQISDLQMEYLNEIYDICQENGTQLLLFKAPREGWHKSHTDAVTAIAAEKGIQFVDYNTLIDEVGLDLAGDFRDKLHLNDFGAEKLSSHFGQFLTDHYDLTDRRTDKDTTGENSFDVAVRYQERAFADQFHSINDLPTYLQQIQNTDGLTVVISADGMTGTLDADSQQILADYGITQDDINQTGQWIIQNGDVIFHTAGVHNYHKNLEIGKTNIVVVQTGSFTKIYIDGAEYHKTDNGLNFAVYDNLTKLVSDAVGFDGPNGLVAVREVNVP